MERWENGEGREVSVSSRALSPQGKKRERQKPKPCFEEEHTQVTQDHSGEAGHALASAQNETSFWLHEGPRGSWSIDRGFRSRGRAMISMGGRHRWHNCTQQLLSE